MADRDRLTGVGPDGSQEKGDLEVFNNLAEDIYALVERNPEYRRIARDGGVVVETW